MTLELKATAIAFYTLRDSPQSRSYTKEKEVLPYMIEGDCFTIEEVKTLQRILKTIVHNFIEDNPKASSVILSSMIYSFKESGVEMSADLVDILNRFIAHQSYESVAEEYIILNEPIEFMKVYHEIVKEL